MTNLNEILAVMFKRSPKRDRRVLKRGFIKGMGYAIGKAYEQEDRRTKALRIALAAMRHVIEPSLHTCCKDAWLSTSHDGLLNHSIDVLDKALIEINELESKT